MRAVRSLFEGEFERVVNCEVSDRVGSCKENVRRNVRYLIELRAVRSLLEKYSEVFDRVGAVRNLLEELQRYSIELGVERMLGKCKELSV